MSKLALSLRLKNEMAARSMPLLDGCGDLKVQGYPFVSSPSGKSPLPSPVQAFFAVFSKILDTPPPLFIEINPSARFGSFVLAPIAEPLNSYRTSNPEKTMDSCLNSFGARD